MWASIEVQLREFGVQKGDRLLVAVSGGPDSMALLHLLHGAGHRLAVAHCNFGLRGADSDADEQLVQTTCERLGIGFHARRFKRNELEDAPGKSVQMMARQLRYAFFNELMDGHGYVCTAIAHHADDRIESLVLNILRGTGIRGLQGMPAMRGRIIRPLIGVSRAELEEYVRINNIAFRTDASNLSTKYRRNRVRLHLLPMLRALMPDVDDRLTRLATSVERLLSEYHRWVEREGSQLLYVEKGVQVIDRDRLRGHPYPFTLLSEIIGEWGYSSAIVRYLLSDESPESGFFDSGSHRLYPERGHFRLVPLTFLDSPPVMSFTERPVSPDDTADRGSDTVVVDAGRFSPSLASIRKWWEGDRFRPLGMQGSKKLSDFMIDHRFSQFQKDTTWLLVQGDEVVWVIGHRMDDRFKVTPATERVVAILAKGLIGHDFGPGRTG